VDTLKAVVGQDELRREEKHKQQGGTFRFEGMVLIASNEQLAATDYTSGLERRLLVVKFTRRYTPEEKAGFIKYDGEAQLQAEIPAIIQWALGLSREDVTRYFMRPPKAVADWSLESLTEQNPVVEWITENLETDPAAWTMIGLRGERRDHGVVTFDGADSKLYPNYLAYCHQTKREGMALTRFRNTVLDMLATLKIPAQPKRRGEGQGILGVKIRPKMY
jgi:putative DNA primase/helicase